MAKVHFALFMHQIILYTLWESKIIWNQRIKKPKNHKVQCSLNKYFGNWFRNVKRGIYCVGVGYAQNKKCNL